MIERVPHGLHSLLDYRAVAENDSMVNTPNTWSIYMVDLVCKWLKGEGGVNANRVVGKPFLGITFGPPIQGGAGRAPQRTRCRMSRISSAFRSRWGCASM